MKNLQIEYITIDNDRYFVSYTELSKDAYYQAEGLDILGLRKYLQEQFAHQDSFTWYLKPQEFVFRFAEIRQLASDLEMAIIFPHGGAAMLFSKAKQAYCFTNI